LRDFFERHNILFIFILPVMIFAGVAVRQASFPIAVLGVLYLAYKDKHSSILLLLVFVFVMGDTRLSFFQFFKDLRMVVLLTVTVISLYELRVGYYRLNSQFLYILPFFVVAMISLLFSFLVSLSFSKTISFILFYFVMLNYLHHKFERYGYQLMIDILSFMVAILAIGFMLYPIYPKFVSYGGIRYNGLMGNPNGMGMFVTTLVPIATYLFVRPFGIKRFFKTLTWILLVVSLLMCSSRNALFSVALFLVLYFGLRGNSYKWVSFVFILVPMAVILASNIDLERLVFSLGLERYLRVSEFDTGSGRIFAWQHAISVIKDSPLVGCGFACEEWNFGYKLSFQLRNTGHQGGVHNSYLAFVMNTGVFGTFFYFTFLINILRKIRNRGFLLAFTIAILFSAIFESWLFASLGAFHILFISFAVFLIVDTNREELLVSSLAGDFSNKSQEGMVR
jgi:O-antigen ligase